MFERRTLLCAHLSHHDWSVSAMADISCCIVCLMKSVVFLFQLAALEFPPKKLFGNRDERMVAERRNHLEARQFNINIKGQRVDSLVSLVIEMFELT